MSSLFKLQCVLRTLASVHVHYYPRSFKDRKDGFYAQTFLRNTSLDPEIWSLHECRLWFPSHDRDEEESRSYSSGKLYSSDSKHSSYEHWWGRLCQQKGWAPRQPLGILFQGDRLPMLLLTGTCEKPKMSKLRVRKTLGGAKVTPLMGRADGWVVNSCINLEILFTGDYLKHISRWLKTKTQSNNILTMGKTEPFLR